MSEAESIGREWCGRHGGLTPQRRPIDHHTKPSTEYHWHRDSFDKRHQLPSQLWSLLHGDYEPNLDYPTEAAAYEAVGRVVIEQRAFWQ